MRELTAYIGAGSSIGKSADFIFRALKAVNRLDGVKIVKISPVYQSEPLGGIANNDFLNLVFEIRTAKPAIELFRHLKEIEKLIGRKDRARWSDREIDLDIILYGDLIINGNELVIPHKGMTERDFVLLPLLDLAPDFKHPVTGKRLKEYRENLGERFILEESKKAIFKIENDEVVLIHE